MKYNKFGLLSIVSLFLAVFGLGVLCVPFRWPFVTWKFFFSYLPFFMAATTIAIGVGIFSGIAYLVIRLRSSSANDRVEPLNKVEG